ncbi:MAG: glycosyltransferase family 4 protein, partial [Verrucomicrobia bacterium]|nr:glycosyltransferase family 4 protein [Verrucomicrobiota bacterium]
QLKPLRPMVRRLSRRVFAPLEAAAKVQGRPGEFRRLFVRALGRGDEGLNYEVNDWLMRTMARECRRPSVSAVHCYEDASLWEFQEAQRLGKACLYDMPIGYYPAWEETQARLAAEFRDWLPAGGLPSSRWARPQQKREEMELADLVLAPGSFVKKTITKFLDKKIALAPYGVDADFWRPPAEPRREGPLTFIYAGQVSIRKGAPVLIEAWRRAALKDARLELTGLWQLAPEKLRTLPPGITHRGPCSREELREVYRRADVFVFPSFFEGFGLVVLEAMACGLPVIASDASAGPDVLDEQTGRVIAAGDTDALVESLRWFAANRDRLPAMRAAARAKAERSTWEHYRQCVADAVAPFAN